VCWPQNEKRVRGGKRVNGGKKSEAWLNFLAVVVVVVVIVVAGQTGVAHGPCNQRHKYGAYAVCATRDVRGMVCSRKGIMIDDNIAYDHIC
jgi:hypothetical protein